MYKLGFKEAEEPEIKLPTFIGSPKKQQSSRKTSTSALLTMPKPLIVWITKNHGKLLKRWEYQTTLPVSWETCAGQETRVRTRHGTTDWFKIGKRLWCWEGLQAGGKGDDRGWDDWMASLTRWMWVWVNSGSCDGQGGLECCDSWVAKSRTRLSDWTELNWT